MIFLEIMGILFLNIKEQEKYDQMVDKITTKELENPFRDDAK